MNTCPANATSPKTYGNVSTVNTHPFHYDGQIFAQNGKIDDFNKHKPLNKI
jgi:predicted glutamine amidotransferase